MNIIEQLDETLAAIAGSLSWKAVMSYDATGNLVGITMGTHGYLLETAGIDFQDPPKPALRVVE